MKSRAFVVLASLFLTAVPFASARDLACSTGTVRGSYAFTIHGQIFSGSNVIVVDGVALTEFNGGGGLSQVDAVSQNGQLPAGNVWRLGTGTYSVDPDCKGRMTINNPGMPFPLQLAIVVGDDGNTIRTVVLNPGFAITSEANRVKTEDSRESD